MAFQSSWCLVMVERLFLAVPRGCLQFVIVVFPDHTHLLFFKAKVVKEFLAVSESMVHNQNIIFLQPCFNIVNIVFKNVFCYCCIVIFIICIKLSEYTHNITRCTDHYWFYKRPILMETIGASLEIVLTIF